MKLGGWSKYEMVLRHTHLAPDHLAEYAAAVMIRTGGKSTMGEREPAGLRPLAGCVGNFDRC